jgi:hypothetical protein
MSCAKLTLAVTMITKEARLDTKSFFMTSLLLL